MVAMQYLRICMHALASFTFYLTFILDPPSLQRSRDIHIPAEPYAVILTCFVVMLICPVPSRRALIAGHLAASTVATVADGALISGADWARLIPGRLPIMLGMSLAVALLLYGAHRGVGWLMSSRRY